MWKGRLGSSQKRARWQAFLFSKAAHLGNFRCSWTPIRLRRAGCCPASVRHRQPFPNKDFANVTAVTTKDGARATEIALFGSIRFLRTRTSDVKEFQASPGNQLLQPSCAEIAPLF